MAKSTPAPRPVQRRPQDGSGGGQGRVGGRRFNRNLGPCPVGGPDSGRGGGRGGGRNRSR